jgi:formate-dependent phosphoribosylglycinamide formyltransferase (GAR transformylase)
MQEIQKHNQNRITTVEAEVTASRWCFVTDATDFSRAARMIGLSASNPPSIRSSNGTGKALLKEQGQ